MSSVCAAASMGARGIGCVLIILILLFGSGHAVVAADATAGERVALVRQVHIGADAAAPSIPTFTPREIGVALVLVALVVLLSVALRDILRRHGGRHPY